MSTFGKTVLWIIVLVLIVWGVFALSQKPGDEEAEASTIKLGFAGPLSGELANMGENARAAVQIAVEEINAAGGVLGKQVTVVYEDDLCTGAGGANAVSKLINTDKVVAVLGGLCSGATLGEAPISEAAKVPQISYCSTNPSISDAGYYIFRNVPSDLFQANFAAEHLIQKDMKNVAVLSVKNDWGEGLSKAFVAAFEKQGGTVVANEQFDPESKDLKAQLTTIKSKKPDAVYFAAYTDASIAGLKQAADLKFKTHFMGADAWDDTKIWSELGTIGDGAMFTVVGTNSTDEFKMKMKEKLGKEDLVYCSNYAYDALKIVAAAIEKAGDTDGMKVKDALYATDYTGGVSAKEMRFDSKGDPTVAAYILKMAKAGIAEEVK